MHFSTVYSLSLALGLATYLHAHMLDDSIFTKRDSALFGPFSRRNLEDGVLVTRQAGARCGAGASCQAGGCCSADGICGTGGAFCTAPACQVQYGPACDGNKSPSGQDTSKDPRPQIGSLPTGVVITKCTVPGKVALTFDDGPYVFTATLLDTLSKAGAKATFFVTGINGGKGDISDPATGYPALIQRMIREGHQVASHTWSHQDLTLLNKQQRYDQLIKNEIALTKILGFFPAYMRPPYSFTNADVLADLKTLGYHVVNFDLDTNDWKGDYAAAKNTFNSALSSGSKASSSFLTLAHDIHQQTVNDLTPYMIERVKALGYTFATVGECLGDPSTNWYRDPVAGTGVKDASGAIAKAANTQSTNTTLPSATVAVSAFGAQSSGHGNATTNARNSTTTQPAVAGISSAAASASARPNAAVPVVTTGVLSGLGAVSCLSALAFLFALL